MREPGPKTFPRPWYLGVIVTCVGIGFCGIGVGIVYTSAAVSVDALIGVLVAGMGAWFVYAFGLLPRVGIHGQTLVVRDLAPGSPWRPSTRRFPRSSIREVSTLMRPHHMLPLDMAYPALVTASEELVILEKLGGFVTGGSRRNERVAQITKTINDWMQLQPGGPAT